MKIEVALREYSRETILTIEIFCLAKIIMHLKLEI